MEKYSVDGLQLVVRILYGKQCFMLPVSCRMTFEMLREEIFTRHQIKATEVFSLFYFTPGSIKCLLQTDADFKMMLFASKTYDLSQIDINVSIVKERRGVGFRNNYFDLNIHAEVDEFLGLPYKSTVVKSYISDEWGFHIRGVGQKFHGGFTEFCEKMKKYAIQKGFNYLYARNDQSYISVVCEDADCAFFIKGSVLSVNKCFFIHQCQLMHSCKSVLRKSSHERLDSDIVADCVLKDVMYNPSIRPKEIIVKFKLNYGFHIGYKVATNARFKAMEKIFGKEMDSFNKLMGYIDAVEKINPGSYVNVEVDPKTNRFKRVFIAYVGCVASFKHCVPVLYVDGCFGKSMYKGKILAATSKDGNKETEDNWVYFFTHLKKIIDAQLRVITFISDRGLGLLAAFDKIFPGNPHLFCYFHLQNNLRNRYTGKGSGLIAENARHEFFKCAYSSTEREFYHNLKELRFQGGPAIIDDFLNDLPLKHWCRAFAVGCRFGIMANTIAESFNSWISIERSMAVYSMLEEVRLRQMELLSDRRTESKLWTSTLTPNIETELEEEIDKCRRFKVIKSHEGLYEVRDVYSYAVDLKASTCSCMKWQINCFPCPHVLAAIMESKLDVYNYIHPVFKVESFRKAYEHPIKPVPNLDQAFFDDSGVFV